MLGVTRSRFRSPTLLFSGQFLSVCVHTCSHRFVCPEEMLEFCIGITRLRTSGIAELFYIPSAGGTNVKLRGKALIFLPVDFMAEGFCCSGGPEFKSICWKRDIPVPWK